MVLMLTKKMTLFVGICCQGIEFDLWNLERNWGAGRCYFSIKKTFKTSNLWKSGQILRLKRCLFVFRMNLSWIFIFILSQATKKFKLELSLHWKNVKLPKGKVANTKNSNLNLKTIFSWSFWAQFFNFIALVKPF